MTARRRRECRRTTLVVVAGMRMWFYAGVYHSIGGVPAIARVVWDGTRCRELCEWYDDGTRCLPPPGREADEAPIIGGDRRLGTLLWFG